MHLNSKFTAHVSERARVSRILLSSVLSLATALGCSGTPAPQEAATANASATPAPAPGPAEIKASIDYHLDRIQQCFIAGTFKDPALKGRVQVTFTIEPSGQVSDIFDDGSELADPNVIECVMDIVKNTRFPAGGQFAQEITYPFHFKGRS